MVNPSKFHVVLQLLRTRTKQLKISYSQYMMLKRKHHFRNSANGVSYGENEMSDWTDEEFEKSLLPKSFYKRLRKDAKFIRTDAPKAKERAMPAPDFFDWRAREVISPVKAQGKCGSCWAFAATATVEAAWAIAHGEMRNLSEQTLLDCDLEDNACDGGDEDKAFRYIHRNGLAYADHLPYVARRQNTCEVDGNTTKIDVAYFLHPDEQSIIDWLLGFGPVNIGISVTKDMRAYKGGVFTPSAYDCKNNVIGLHSLLITGYGTSKTGEKYWIVKNSWGNTWGVENGYVYFARGINACGIEDEPIGILA
uniref:Pept_C1 domain-containing protein n=1 Tax=Angiostrongylus cantonensis TaxID=6313 RepID=A0A158P6U0_ANGCA